MRKKILLIKLWAIGEVLFSTPCISRLKANLSDADLYFLVGDNAKDIIIGNPNVKEVITVDEDIFLKPNLLKLLELIMNLRKEKFDIIAILHYNPFFSLFAFLVGANKRIGLKRSNMWSLNTADIINRDFSENKIFENLKVL